MLYCIGICCGLSLPNHWKAVNDLTCDYVLLWNYLPYSLTCTALYCSILCVPQILLWWCFRNYSKSYEIQSGHHAADCLQPRCVIVCDLWAPVKRRDSNFDRFCLYVCMSVCLSHDNFRKTSCRKFIFANQVCLHALWVNFVNVGQGQGHRTE